MASTGSLGSDPLFVGLTRPTLIFGVSIMYEMLNMMICVVAFINTSDIRIIGLALIVHIVGYIACFKEPRFMELTINKLDKCNKCPNKSYYGANSYSV
ncbi:MAG: VirB3 family type IV secretion system protein [Pseudomonadota bacterium]